MAWQPSSLARASQLGSSCCSTCYAHNGAYQWLSGVHVLLAGVLSRPWTANSGTTGKVRPASPNSRRNLRGPSSQIGAMASATAPLPQKGNSARRPGGQRSAYRVPPVSDWSGLAPHALRPKSAKPALGLDREHSQVGSPGTSACSGMKAVTRGQEICQGRCLFLTMLVTPSLVVVHRQEGGVWLGFSCCSGCGLMDS